MTESNVYLEHWSLKNHPFVARPDSRFLYLTTKHEHALAALSFAACEGGEPVLLRGPAGCGKTILLRALRRQLPRETYHVAFVPETSCARTDLLPRVAYHLTHKIVTNPTDAMTTIGEFTHEAGENGRAIVLMFDNWPAAAEPRMLEELRWLLGLDIEQDCRVDVLIAGEDIRPRKHWPAWLVQRLFTTVQVGPLENNEISLYLAHRLRCAADAPADSTQYDEVFSSGAATEIAGWSRGVPRLVNRAAHLSLRSAYLEKAKQVTQAHVNNAIERLDQNPHESSVESAERQT